MRSEKSIGGKTCYIYGCNKADICLIQPVGEHELITLDREVEFIKKLARGDFAFAAVPVESWNDDLSPWKAPPVFGNEGFGGGAGAMLSYITRSLMPALGPLKKVFIGGYSLAGLFSLWAACESDAFDGVAAVSPSVWFPGWKEYMDNRPPRAAELYLSLGMKEEKTKNAVMSAVGDNIRSQYELALCAENVKRRVLEWNPGGHFADPELRVAKGFAWLINENV